MQINKQNIFSLFLNFIAALSKKIIVSKLFFNFKKSLNLSGGMVAQWRRGNCILIGQWSRSAIVLHKYCLKAISVLLLTSGELTWSDHRNWYNVYLQLHVYLREYRVCLKPIIYTNRKYFIKKEWLCESKMILYIIERFLNVSIH